MQWVSSTTSHHPLLPGIHPVLSDFNSLVSSSHEPTFQQDLTLNLQVKYRSRAMWENEPRMNQVAYLPRYLQSYRQFTRATFQGDLRKADSLSYTSSGVISRPHNFFLATVKPSERWTGDKPSPWLLVLFLRVFLCHTHFRM